ncbi:hypothetical protein MIMGU_mgv1a0215152mg, partial [Erythranthe guttata]
MEGNWLTIPILARTPASKIITTSSRPPMLRRRHPPQPQAKLATVHGGAVGAELGEVVRGWWLSSWLLSPVDDLRRWHAKDLESATRVSKLKDL